MRTTQRKTQIQIRIAGTVKLALHIQRQTDKKGQGWSRVFEITPRDLSAWNQAQSKLEAR
ncbi:MAG: hypothetical protein WAL52_02815 [Candidatus Sulfotelmatobacter sp.]